MIITLLGFLVISIQAQETTTVELFTDQSFRMYEDDAINDDFVIKTQSFDCSAFLYAYSQNQQQFISNLPSQIYIKALPASVTISISTYYSRFTPLLNQTACTSPNCSLQVRYNCPLQLSLYNYFDIIQLNVKDIGTFYWYLNCNQNYNPLYFQWGQLIITLMATIIIILGTIFARLDAFDGSGIEFNLKWVILVSALVLGIGQLIIFISDVANVVLDVITWVLGTIAVGLVILQSFYRFIRHSFLRNSCKIGPIPVRGMDILCLMLGAGGVSIWYFTSKNWIVSDFLSACLIISMIKVFKITKLKIAIVMYIITLSLFILGAVQALIIKGKNFFALFQFSTNSPFQFQMPTITPTYSSNCIWISFTSIAFPGLTIAFFHRFDQSRATNIYLISSITAYFIGSIIWNVISSFTRSPVPFDAVAYPFVLLTIIFMGFNRKQLRTLWDGRFYDEQFTHKKEIQNLEKRLSIEMPEVDMVRKSIPNSIYLQKKDIQIMRQGQMDLALELIGNNEL